MTFAECANQFVLNICDKEMRSRGFATSASTIVELHLATENLPMPIRIQEGEIHNVLQQGSADAATLRACILFEDTRTIEGICRVMARTQLNRSGVGYVSRGEKPKTLTRRVLGLFEQSDDLRRLIDWEPLLDHWLAFAEASRQRGDRTCGGEILFSDCDITALRLLREDPTTCRLRGAHDNWIKVVTGIHSGFKYLSSEPFGFRAENVWARMDDAAGSFESIKTLLSEASHEVEQFGMALAGSFFADLGHHDFVKTDVHVVDSVAAYLRKDRISEREALKFVFEAAAASDMSPRALDKLLYIGGSGKFYLVGINASQPKDQKRAFLHHLRSCGRA